MLGLCKRNGKNGSEICCDTNLCNNAPVDNEPMSDKLTKIKDLMKRADNFVKAVDLAKQTDNLKRIIENLSEDDEYTELEIIANVTEKRINQIFNFDKIADLANKTAYLVKARNEAKQSGDFAKALDLANAVDLANKATSLVKDLESAPAIAVDLPELNAINKLVDSLKAFELAKKANNSPKKIFLEKQIKKLSASLKTEMDFNKEIDDMVKSEHFAKAILLANKPKDSNKADNGAEGTFAASHHALVLISVLASAVISRFFKI
jgi:hypothetical protein